MSARPTISSTRSTSAVARSMLSLPATVVMPTTSSSGDCSASSSASASSDGEASLKSVSMTTGRRGRGASAPRTDPAITAAASTPRAARATRAFRLCRLLARVLLLQRVALVLHLLVDADLGGVVAVDGGALQLAPELVVGRARLLVLLVRRQAREDGDPLLGRSGHERLP